MPRIPSLPSYRLHKPSGQAVITVRTPDGGRRDIYLGEYNSPDSRREYSRIVAELATAAIPQQVTNPIPSQEVNVDEVLLAFWKHAEQHYRRADGTPTHEIMEYRQTFKPLRALYGQILAREFGSLALKAVRGRMIQLGWCRRLINQRVGRIRRVFKWAASEQLVPVATYQGLTTVPGLQKGRTEAYETDPVGPVAEEAIRAALPFMRPQIGGMVELQLLTGMRPTETCLIRPSDIDMSEAIWVYRPGHHKLIHKGKGRAVAIGARGQVILKKFMPVDPLSYFFSPRESVKEFHAGRTVARKTPRFPSHVARNAKKRATNPKRKPAEKYNASSYGHAIVRAIELANRPLIEAGVELDLHIPPWHPNQLRHTHATKVRKRYGLEAAQVALGHSRADVTQVYAERDFALAATIAAEMG